MNARDFSRKDRWMGCYAAFIRDGYSKPGIYGTSAWPTGRPDGAGRPRNQVKRPRPLLPPCQPKETRCTTPKLPCARPVEDELWTTHSAVMRMPEDLKQFIILAWIRRYTDIRDLSVILGMSSREIRRWKVKVFDRIPVKV